MSAFYFPFALTVGRDGSVSPLAKVGSARNESIFGSHHLRTSLELHLCAVCAVAYPGKKTLIESAKLSNWAVFSLGAAAALIELGFLLAYRAGWKISMAAVATNAAAAIALIPIGIVDVQGSSILAKCRRSCILHFRISDGDARLAGGVSDHGWGRTVPDWRFTS